MSLAVGTLESSEDSHRFAADAWRRALQATGKIDAQPARILPIVIDELAVCRGHAPALLSDEGCLSFDELAALSNRYARWALAHGVRPGECVGLLMPNCPDYMAVWLGVTRVGGVVALLNTQLTGSALAHCIDAVSPRHIIVAAELARSLAQADVTGAPVVWTHGDGADPVRRIDRAIQAYSSAPIGPNELPDAVTIDRPALHIYTSGTTGLPKAAVVTHRRIMQWSLWFAGMMDTSAADRMYDCLPMFHSVGGVVATGAVLVNGGSVVIRRSFSARRFWDDVARWDCTLFQYIGELCRYLVTAQDDRPAPTHNLRLCCGNGLRADVWTTFQERFGIPRVLEFYAATEGTFSLYNAEGRPGAIGRIPPFLRHRFPVALVKFDSETDAPARDADGFCIRCGPGEVGEAIGRIEGVRAGGRFEGYTDRQASARKVLRHVFDRGDAWFRTGDLMRTDERGFFYFVDRIGDTFRWKGENVSTAEVAEALTDFPGISEATVFGVDIPGADGRAGMASIALAVPLDLERLRDHLRARLPGYARPLFLRLQRRLEVTPTFKHRKADLVRVGYDPRQTEDALYFDDARRQAFVRVDEALYRQIREGRLRL